MVLTARGDIPVVPVGDDLSPAQKMEEIILQHQDVFFDTRENLGGPP